MEKNNCEMIADAISAPYFDQMIMYAFLRKSRGVQESVKIESVKIHATKLDLSEDSLN